MNSEFLNWWVAQLADLVPPRFKTTPDGGDALIVELPDDWEPAVHPLGMDLPLTRRRKGQTMSLGQVAMGSDRMRRLHAELRRGDRSGQLRLLVPVRLLLEREVVLPLAAERELDNVLRYEMSQLTPFKADGLFWATTMLRRDAVRGKLKLRLSMVPQATIGPLLAALRAVGLAVAALEVLVPGPKGGRRVIGLADRNAHRGGRHRGLRVLAAGCAALAIVAIALPFVLQSRRAAALDLETALLAPRAAEAETLRQRLSVAAGTRDVMAAAAAEVGNPLAVMAALTQALPDDSFLSQLTLNHRQLNIAGESGSAAALLAALSAYPILTDVTFTAPITRDTAAHKDLFSIQIDVAPQ